MKRSLSIALLIFGIVTLILAGTHLYLGPATETQTEEKEIHVAFVLEAYDKIKENYWNDITDEQLSNLYKLAAEKLTETQVILSGTDRNGVEQMTENILSSRDQQAKKEFAASLTDVVLANLEPFGRSRLFTEKQEQSLRNTVNNVDPDKDLYAALGVSKDASEEDIQKAYEEKIQTAQEEERGKIEHAKTVLADEAKRERYDETGAEPTTAAKLLSPQVGYIKIGRFSPSTFEEFQRDANGLESDGLDSLVIDLRGNIGGAVDLLPYFLGPFIGPDQYAYEFFHQGEKIPFKTKTGWLKSLVKYKKVVVLINEETQSSAEVMAATLKKYNVGVVVGTKTKGHGTIEKLILMETQISPEEKFSMFIVENLALNDNGQPIEKNGVEPHVNITDKSWKNQLMGYYNYKPLVDAVQKIW